MNVSNLEEQEHTSDDNVRAWAQKWGLLPGLLLGQPLYEPVVFMPSASVLGSLSLQNPGSLGGCKYVIKKKKNPKEQGGALDSKERKL